MVNLSRLVAGLGIPIFPPVGRVPGDGRIHRPTQRAGSHDLADRAVS